MTKKVLIISYTFPPTGGAGVQRVSKFVKFLYKFDWEPVVLTVLNPSVPIIDDTLHKDIPAGLNIYGARTLEPSYDFKRSIAAQNKKTSWIKQLLKKIVSMFFLPDIQILWWPGLFFQLFSIIKKDKPVCLFVTAPPFSSFFPVIIIGKLFNIPVVLDYRDEWGFARKNWENSVRNNLAYFIDAAMERFCLKHCTAFTTATQSYINSIAENYGSKLQEKGTVITNGFDVDDFVSLKKQERMNTSSDIIRIVYAGTIMKITSLGSFCQALNVLFRIYPEIKNKIVFEVYGRVVGEEQAYLEDDALSDVIKCHGYVGHEIILQQLKNADLLLLTLCDQPGSERIINGKVFEYMATGNHIFAMIPRGETREICSRYGNATIINSDDMETASKMLKELIDNIDVVRNKPVSDISMYTREKLTEKLSNVFNRCSVC